MTIKNCLTTPYRHTFYHFVLFMLLLWDCQYDIGKEKETPAICSEI
jgi:hypothetical protein